MQINVQGSNHGVFLSDAVSLSHDLLGEILSAIKFLDGLEERSEENRNKLISGLTEDISLFVELTTLLSKVILVENKELFRKVKESHIHLLFIIKGVIQTQQKQDILALEDLIKYELKDNLTQWKIDLIPQIKRLL